MKRPSDDTIIKILNNSAGMVTYAAEKLNVTYQTLYTWIKESPNLQQALQAIKEKHLDFAETQLLKKIKEGHEASIFFYLKCIGKDRGYIERTQFEQIGKMKFEMDYVDDQD